MVHTPHMAINNVTVWQRKECIMYREFLGHYLVSSLRTFKSKKPENLKTSS